MHYSYFTGRIYVEKTSEQATLATATHKELEKVSDGTSIQVEVWMINKWRMKMIQKRIYKVKDPLWKGDRKGREKNNIAIWTILIF